MPTTMTVTESRPRSIVRADLIQAAGLGARITARACRARGLDVAKTRARILGRLEGHFDPRSFDLEPMIDAVDEAIEAVWAEPNPGR
jgi:hypothetical protein